MKYIAENRMKNSRIRRPESVLTNSDASLKATCRGTLIEIADMTLPTGFSNPLAFP